MPPLAGYWHSLLAKHGHVWKAAYKEATKAIEARISGRVPAAANAEYAYAHIPTRQSVHSVARIRQGQSGWLTSKRRFDAAVRYFTSQSRAVKDASARPRSSFQSATWTTIQQSPGRAPFASTLRPNLTGGTLGRTAGGYSLGGGRAGAQRHFSHGPACQAHVVQNVSQAVRAFLVGGQKAQFNGVSSVTGGKKYKAVSRLQEETGRKMKELPRTTPGSHVDFSINPTITALTSLRNVTGYSKVEEQHLNTEGLLDVLSTDFSRQLQELCAVLADLRKLSVLGDLPITYLDSSLRVHFPGCDAETVESLCQELGVRRGLVIQDEDFDAFVGTEMALLFPFAPSETPSEAADLFEDGPIKHHMPVQQVDWRAMLTSSEQSSAYSTRSEFEMEDIAEDNPWESVGEHSSDFSEEVCSSSHSPLEYQGIEGIYRFIEQCDSVNRR
ncbi:hypothetical protein K461DRAFT_275080 [Myriangium duriaei CBS 260.36]|uniref:Uncharacterized protein n=1 Tax=Myriangium duriaei CBS 260.36 TaxID=1168546 RepID=A0A9P4J6X1_9PEZI|nr:hypothetical protein K461DRAFT_275080 [Myriangium duriaei CBS 260.36]